MLKFLKYPIKVRKLNGSYKISIKGQKQFRAFKYKIPVDISSAAFFIVLTILSKNSQKKTLSMRLHKRFHWSENLLKLGIQEEKVRVVFTE